VAIGHGLVALFESRDPGIGNENISFWIVEDLPVNLSLLSLSLASDELTDGSGKDQITSITSHQVPKSMSLYNHPKYRSQDIPDGSKLITKDIIDIPN
jgi:hypothetical protein